MHETVFQESAAKVAIGFFSEIKIFENTAFGHVTEVPIKNQKLNRLINTEYQHKSKSVTKGSALFIHMDQKYALYSIFHV